MQPLIDLDILLYEIGFGAEYGREEIIDFKEISVWFDSKIQEITKAVDSDRPPILYYTGKTNFRNEIAKRKGYKANRKDSKKPFHYYNILNYAIASYDCRMQEGLEADDLMCIEQTKRLDKSDTIICSRDKDLRQCEGWHYSWECGRQPERLPYFVEGIGTLELGKSSLLGTGLKFFYAQTLMGDVVDNIEGLKGYGKKRVYELLKDAKTEEELLSIVLGCYEEKYAENASEELIEQARLVWMVRELDEEGNPVMWEIPKYEREK